MVVGEVVEVDSDVRVAVWSAPQAVNRSTENPKSVRIEYKGAELGQRIKGKQARRSKPSVIQPQGPTKK